MKNAALITPSGNEAFLRLRKVQASNGGGNLHKIGLRYALERFLYRVFEVPDGEAARLFLSPEGSVEMDRATITLKGGMTMTFAEEVPPLKGRSTGDADLHLAAFPGSMRDYADILGQVLEGGPRAGPDDGVRFDVGAIEIRHDREERSGGSVTVPLHVGPLWLQVKTDVTFDGRPMHDRAPVVAYPSVMPDANLPAPRVRRVPYEFMVADKLGAALEYGAANIRIRDYHDMRLILGKGMVDPDFLAETVAATLRFKGIEPPASIDEAPGFSDDFAQAKASRWERERKDKNYQMAESFPEVVAFLRDRLGPVLASARETTTMPGWAFLPR